MVCDVRAMQCNLAMSVGYACGVLLELIDEAGPWTIWLKCNAHGSFRRAVVEQRRGGKHGTELVEHLVEICLGHVQLVRYRTLCG